MSNNEYENGKFTLPSIEVGPLRKVLRDDQNAFADAVRAEAMRIHGAIATTSRTKYDAGIQAQRRARAPQFDRSTHQWARTGDVTEAAFQVLSAMLWRREGKAPVQPILDDYKHIAPRANTSTTIFPIVDDGGWQAGAISFDGRHVTWSVYENNHAVDHARDGRTARVFFTALRKIRWTRGTGGFIMYDSEYHEDEMGNRTGASLSAHWGPLGEAEKVRDLQRSGFSQAQAIKMAKMR